MHKDVQDILKCVDVYNEQILDLFEETSSNQAFKEGLWQLDEKFMLAVKTIIARQNKGENTIEGMTTGDLCRWVDFKGE